MKLGAMAKFWKTSLSKVSRNKVLIRGYRVQDLMEHCSFGDMIYLSFTGELPSGDEGRILESIVVSSTEHSVMAPSKIVQSCCRSPYLQDVGPQRLSATMVRATSASPDSDIPGMIATPAL